MTAHAYTILPCRLPDGSWGAEIIDRSANLVHLCEAQATRNNAIRAALNWVNSVGIGTCVVRP